MLFINNSLDTRYDPKANSVVSHNKTSEPCVSLDKLSDIQYIKDFDDYDVVIIEEAQFFPDLYDYFK